MTDNILKNQLVEIRTSDGCSHIGTFVSELGHKPLSCAIVGFDGQITELNGSYIVSRKVLSTPTVKGGDDA